jgi:hypothetical protein
VRQKRAELLTEGADWFLQEGIVMLTPEGANKLRAVFGLLDAPPPEKDAGAPADVTEEVICCKTNLPNPRIILARKKDDQVVRVRVKDSAHFTLGMTITATHIQEDLYEYCGRLPRQKGRW